MKKKIIPIVILAAVLVIGGGYLYRWLNRNDNGRILISGNIELTEVKVAFKTAGRLVERAYDEGDTVKKGAVAARLDREQLERQLERERATLAGAESALVQLRTAIAYQRETLDGETAARTAELGQADARLRELSTGSRPQEIQDAKAAVEAARTEQARARNDWERAKVLFQNDDISASQNDQFRTAYERAAALLQQAEQRLALVTEGPRQENIDAAKAGVERARATVRLAQASRLELKRKEQELGARRADIDRAKAQIAVIESQLNDSAVTSPIDGVVLVKSAEVGETLGAGATVLTIGDLDHPWLRGYINETDLGRVKLRSKVKVTTDSFPGKVYWGTVSFISSEAEFTPKQIQTPEERVKLVYRVKVDLPNPGHELKSNMPADAEILVADAGR
ncbi:MAG TPA: efflux RND transporter periplasmic adaptor subunit [Bryobacteraceae bacterium]|nr:efflux RND transporter periplasmic adaptor subunit [Bryobacteraceae bacterium]